MGDRQHHRAIRQSMRDRQHDLSEGNTFWSYMIFRKEIPFGRTWSFGRKYLLVVHDLSEGNTSWSYMIFRKEIPLGRTRCFYFAGPDVSILLVPMFLFRWTRCFYFAGPDVFISLDQIFSENNEKHNFSDTNFAYSQKYSQTLSKLFAHSPGLPTPIWRKNVFYGFLINFL